MKSFGDHTVHIHSPHVPVHWCLRRVTSEDVTSALLSGRVSVAECLQLDAVEVACTFLPAAGCMYLVMIVEVASRLLSVGAVQALQQLPQGYRVSLCR